MRDDYTPPCCRRAPTTPEFYRLHVEVSDRQWPRTIERVERAETAENGELVIFRVGGGIKVFAAGWKSYDLVPDTQAATDERKAKAEEAENRRAAQRLAGQGITL